MKTLIIGIILVALFGCQEKSFSHGDSLKAEELEQFFRKHKIDGNSAVALKKRSITESYLVTIHGYPNNFSVCEQLIEPYNKIASKSAVGGNYYCEVLD